MESDNYMTARKAAPGGGREREEPGARGSVRVGRGEGRGRGLEARTWGGRGGPPRRRHTGQGLSSLFCQLESAFHII